MSELAKILEAIQLFNLTAAAAQKLYLAIKNPDGTLTVVDTLDRADAQFKANQDAADAWFAQHSEK